MYRLITLQFNIVKQYVSLFNISDRESASVEGVPAFIACWGEHKGSNSTLTTEITVVLKQYYKIILNLNVVLVLLSLIQPLP